MSGDGAQLTFGELVARHGRIQIPLIQRDYAQGRSDQGEVREEFLLALRDALTAPPEAAHLPLNLDFIYGSAEGDALHKFLPLDGQQRLTTLFLLHWYLAWQDSCSESFHSLCTENDTSRFNYKVRPSSNEFFDSLSVFLPAQTPDSVESVSALLSDQPWYFRNWRLDPTIQSALVMLDSIHKHFRDCHGLYSRLTDTQRPSITFQLLDLRNFGLSDDLYIKMNARGKPLTAFETFKARFEQILEQNFQGHQKVLNGQAVSISEFFSRRMDTRWADFFWPYRNRDSHVFDAAVMNLFRSIILLTRSAQSDDFVEHAGLLRSRNTKNSYAFFHNNGWLDAPFSETLITLLELWSAGEDDFSSQLPNTRFFDEAAFFRKAVSDPAGMTYEEIVLAYAYINFLKEHSADLHPEKFQEWMRVAFNLSANTEYNRASDLQRSFASIEDLVPYMSDILAHLALPDTDIPGFSRQQVAEEKLKARLILVDSAWVPLIHPAEQHPYFRGQIGFLLQFAGIAEHDANADIAHLNEIDAKKFQSSFIKFLSIAESMFGASGLTRMPEYLWERALLSIGNYLLPAHRNHALLVDLPTEPFSWKRLLRVAGTGAPQGDVLQKAWEILDASGDIAAQLNDIISSATPEPWREALIDGPAAIDYCKNRMIRMDSGKVYLLKRTQMNGAHVELFSYHLYQKEFSNAALCKALNVITPRYEEKFSSEEEPRILLRADVSSDPVTFFLHYRTGEYSISTSTEGVASSQVMALLTGFGFSEVGVDLVKLCKPEDIRDAVFALDELLTAAAS